MNPYPANYDPNNCNDPNCGLYGTNLVNLTLKDGTQIQDTKGDYNPFATQIMQSTWLFTTDAALFKSFSFKDRMKLKVEADFFNVFNTPGNEYAPNNPNTSALGDATGIVLKNYSMNGPRTVQLSARFTW